MSRWAGPLVPCPAPPPLEPQTSLPRGVLHSNPMDYAWGANGLDAIITQVQGGLPEVGTGVLPSFLLLRMRGSLVWMPCSPALHNSYPEAGVPHMDLHVLLSCPGDGVVTVTLAALVRPFAGEAVACFAVAGPSPLALADRRPWGQAPGWDSPCWEGSRRPQGCSCPGCKVTLTGRADGWVERGAQLRGEVWGPGKTQPWCFCR